MPNLNTSPTEDLFFLDTNIFVYALLASEPLKKQRAVQLLEQALGNHSGCISYQVIHEFANVATRRFRQRMTNAECLQFIEAAMEPLNRVPSSSGLVNVALTLQNETGYSFYDSLILAGALQAGATTLYTEDLPHHQLIGGSLRIVNPFLLLAMQADSSAG
ncbi:MAG: PIN domain-containing protein [Rhodoferax sp.]|nr:PIN domain-containing protein [Rhodoferax sp.]